MNRVRIAVSSLMAAIVTAGLCLPAEAAEPVPGGKTYRLDCSDDASVFELPPQDLPWQELHRMLDDKASKLIQIVDRSQVDSSLYIDTEGLRLYVASAACRQRFEELPRDSGDQITLNYLVRNLLLRRYSASGIEPDRIPVRGEAGKKLGKQGMVKIKAGEYVRPGHYYTSQSAELGERTGESYKVNVSAFFIDKYKVTNQQYCDFLNDNNPGYWNSATWSNITRSADGLFEVAAEKAQWPVVAVNWYQAAGYAEWVGKRLPTEAEWEFAAAGPEGRKYPWGNESPDITRGHFAASGQYTPVDAFPAGATPEGVFGLAGNAAEWCADFYSHDYYDNAPPDGVLTDPTGPALGNPDQGFARMFKGFCQARETPQFLECTKRHARAPLLTAAIGFRCVKPDCGCD
jgi:formylglycine-generating enzyme required for sulfatase activity